MYQKVPGLQVFAINKQHILGGAFFNKIPQFSHPLYVRIDNHVVRLNICVRFPSYLIRIQDQCTRMQAQCIRVHGRCFRIRMFTT